MTKINKTQAWLGCIADDYTGATDLASFLVAGGLKTLQVNGIPSTEFFDAIDDIDAVVIALKSRTSPVQEAVQQSLEALQFLRSLGCEKYYFKYCSTFDSSAKGNIGPVTDALLDALDETATVVCPALPVNGRTVYQGHLFVFDQPLHESPMKDHPLTPMRDSSVLRMMEAQSKGKTALVPYSLVAQGEEVIAQAFNKAKQEANYVVVDALSQEHLAHMGKGLAQFTLMTGGSGLALGVSKLFEKQGGTLKKADDLVKAIDAPALILSGSCSAMTQKQVASYAAKHPCMSLDIDKLVSGEESVSDLLAWLEGVLDQSPLVAATAKPEVILRNQEKYGAQRVAELVENTLAELARQAQEKLGVRNFIVAGGETSGAVVKSLGVDSFLIGKAIAPGVPVVQTLNLDPLNLALKSGNFGDEDFFFHAVEALTCC